MAYVMPNLTYFRFDRLYGWFKDAGDKEVAKELPLLVNPCVSHITAVAVQVVTASPWAHESLAPQEQQGPAFVRYDPAKPVMAGSTRGIPKTSDTMRLARASCEAVTVALPSYWYDGSP